jgi:hypothetical protein
MEALMPPPHTAAPSNNRIWFGCSDPLFCYSLLNTQNRNDLNVHNKCASNAGWSFSADIAKCLVACIPFALAGGPPAYGACVAACVGVTGLINLWTWGKCWDHYYQQLQYNLNNYCLCLNKRAKCPQRFQRRESLYHAVNCGGTPIPMDPNVPFWPDDVGPIDLS